ncbi:hypothetical protein LVJ94_12110 [Pendulispora rubella]|uniref:Uncharacterized protein n=1 Tax=Pendulispora rubella TaxID=2741070 RepID=A0ABZ2LAM4_9BACT
MNKRDEDEHQIDTVPPPPGEDDAYSAETRIGKIPSDLLQAMKRAHASEAGRPSLPPDLVAALGDKGAVSSRPSVPASRTVPRPLSVPRVTPTIPPPPETTPAIAEGIPSFGLPSFGPAAGSPAPPKRTDGPAEFTLEGLASDDQDYVGSMLGAATGPAASPPTAPAGLPAVQIGQIVPAVPMVAPAIVPSPAAPTTSTDDVAPTSVQPGSGPQAGPAAPLVVPVDAPVADLDLPVPGPMRPLTDSQVEEGRMSFTPFTEQSRRLNIILMVSIGFLLLLTVIVLIAAK